MTDATTTMLYLHPQYADSANKSVPSRSGLVTKTRGVAQLDMPPGTLSTFDLLHNLGPYVPAVPDKLKHDMHVAGEWSTNYHKLLDLPAACTQSLSR